MTGEQAPPGVDPTVPTPARMYDYMLRGTHNYQVDRDAVEKNSPIATVHAGATAPSPANSRHRS